jgi:formamidopyrimidine-DNA glycosylase
LIETKTLHTSEHLKDTGPEPLEKTFEFTDFTARLALKPRGKIKQVLMDPKIIAGIGNIYSDEILWACRVHPLSIVSKIPRAQLNVMFRSMKEVLTKGIDFGGDSTSDYRNPLGEHGTFHYHHKAYRETGKPCPKTGCRGTIEKIRMNGRHAHFCPIHQTKY